MKSKDMTIEMNHLGQPLGPVVENWQKCPRPNGDRLVGRYCYLEPLNADRHGSDLFAANSQDQDGAIWTYLPYGPYEDEADYLTWIRDMTSGNDPFFQAVMNLESGKAEGIASFMRINEDMGSIEVGHINFSPALQKTRAATEAIYLMIKHGFDLGYRRFEWKCNALNAGSVRAAERYGFTAEGVHRYAGVYKGRSRDTAWFSILDHEWPDIQARFEAWLDPANFDDQGNQKMRLAEVS